MTTRRSRWLFLLMIALSASWALAQQRQPAQTAASELDDYVRGFRFSELASRVPELPASLQRDYFAGVLANREGRSGDSVVLL